MPESLVARLDILPYSVPSVPETVGFGSVNLGPPVIEIPGRLAADYSSFPSILANILYHFLSLPCAIICCLLRESIYLLS